MKHGRLVPVLQRWNGARWVDDGGIRVRSGGIYGVSCVSRRFCVAVGSTFTGRAKPLAPLTELWDGSRWRAMRGGSQGAGYGLEAVSCSSATACTAVGGLAGPKVTKSEPLAEHWNGSRWAIDRATVAGGLLYAVSCPSARWCTAFAEPQRGQVSKPVRWDGGRWSPARTPNAGSEQLGFVTSVSCVSPDDCIAVGLDFPRVYEPIGFAERWDGRTWKLQDLEGVVRGERSAGSRLVSKGLAGELFGVSCQTHTSCVAVGNRVKGTLVTLAIRWNGARWSAQSTPSPNVLEYPLSGSLNSVSCTTATACTAVGWWVGFAVQLALTERWDGSRWSFEPMSDPAAHDGLLAGVLAGVSCPSVTTCVAVNRSPGAAVDTWTDGRWTTAPTPAQAVHSQLFGISCTSPAACTAVGSTPVGGDSVPLAERLTEGGWTVEPSLGPPAGPAYLHAVSCASSTACVAVGGYTYSFGIPASAKLPSETWDGTAWTVQDTPFPAASSALTGISCTSPTACIAVGGVDPPAALSWDGRTWTSQSLPAPADIVSCATASYCMAIGENLTPEPVLVAEVWDGTSWSAQTFPPIPAPNRGGEARPDLRSVSCPAPGMCVAVGDVTFDGLQQPLVEVYR